LVDLDKVLLHPRRKFGGVVSVMNLKAGASSLRQAIGEAERFRLPHQLQRAARVATEYDREIAGTAVAALERTIGIGVADGPG
jgi:hypothetical protein